MAETIYPQITKDTGMQRTMDQAFSKYLQISPARIMLLKINEQEELALKQNQAFCLKSAVID